MPLNRWVRPSVQYSVRKGEGLLKHAHSLSEARGPLQASGRPRSARNALRRRLDSSARELVLLVSYMPLAHGGLVSQKIDWISLRRGRTDIVRWDSKPQ